MKSALDPRTKLLAALMLVTASVLIDSLTGVLLMSALFVAVMLLSQTSFRVYGQNLLLISWLLAMTFLMHVWGQYSMSPDRLSALSGGGLAVVRLCLMLGWVTILSRSSSPLELVNGIESLCAPLRHVGFPVQKFSIVAMLSMRFLPLLFEEGRHLHQAYLARGFDWNEGPPAIRIRHVAELFLPLFSHLLRRVDLLVPAMENRAFQLDGERTSLYSSGMGRFDYFVLCVSVAALLCGTVC